MEKIKTKVKRWGNSFGVVLPKKIVEPENLEEGVEITITIEPRRTMTLKDLMEFAKKHPLPKVNKTTKEIIQEIDKDLWNEE